MKKEFSKSAFFSAGIFAAIFIIILGSVPHIVARSANFLGKDVSQIATGIVGFYPSVAVFEVLRILGVALVIFTLLSFPWVYLFQRGTAGRLRFLFFALGPLFTYGACTIGTLLKYPSFFSAFLPELAQKYLYIAAFWLRPAYFWFLSILLSLAPWIRFVVIAFPKPRFWRYQSKYLLGTIGLSVFVLCSLVAFKVRSTLQPIIGSESQVKAPNVLFIAVDSLRYDRLSRLDMFPSLKALLSDSSTVSFADHHVGVPRTFPSWIELIEGQYAPQTGIRHMFPGFGPRSGELPGFVVSMRDAGYETEVWSDFAGDIFPRFAAGFNSVKAPNLTLSAMIRLSVDQAFPLFLPIMMMPGVRRFFPSLKQSPAFADAGHLTEDLKETLLKGTKPWLKVVFYSTAHFPYAAPHPYYTVFTRPEYQGPFRFEKNPDLAAGQNSITEADKVQVRALYDGAIRSIDDDLAQLFGRLRRSGLWDDTLIVLTADHGEDLYENGRLQGHGEHLRGTNVLQVPLIMKLPKNFTLERKLVDITTRSIDVGPTILDICGVRGLLGSGVSLFPYIQGKAPKAPHLVAYSETGLWFSRAGDAYFQKERLDYPGISGVLNFDQGYSGEIVLDPRFEKIVISAKHRSLVDGDFKLIYLPTPTGVKYELYNRRDDPQNQKNISTSDPVRLAIMRKHLMMLIQQLEKNARIIDDFVVPQ